ncbi:MAG: dienelactone hydrolase family protein [Chloroflexi bacterium]|nr:dienelactone hydrolase family protein [Chloroflexota bacterium]
MTRNPGTRLKEHDLRIELASGDSISAIRTESAARANEGWTFIYAPGAGSNVHDPFGTFACRTLASAGIVCWRFQFPFQEAGKRGPDQPKVLEATWVTVAGNVGSETTDRVVIGGRSMGGRIASQIVADGFEVDGLALFAYPLHPPGRPDKRRDEHIPRIAMPTLFCSGSRGAFASPEELRTAATPLSSSTVHILDHADHGFNVAKSSGRTRQDVWEEASTTFVNWLTLL